MAGKTDSQIARAVRKTDDYIADDSLQDLLWRKFDAMLKEFLQMEQTSPAVQRPESSRRQ